MTESKEKNGEVEILGNTIAEVVAEAVKHAPRGVFGISAGYITDKSELFSSDFEVRPEPITAEKIEQKLTSKLIMEAMLAGDDGRTVSRFVVALKLRETKIEEALESIGKGLPAVVASMDRPAADQATAKAIDDIGKGLPTVVASMDRPAADQATAKAIDDIGKGLPTVVPNL